MDKKKRERRQAALARVAAELSLPVEAVRSMVLGGQDQNREAAARLGITNDELENIKVSYDAAMADAGPVGDEPAHNKRVIARTAEKMSMSVSDIAAVVTHNGKIDVAAARRLNFNKLRCDQIANAYAWAVEREAVLREKQEALSRARASGRANYRYCKHRITREKCPICTPGTKKVVYISSGGSKFHKTRDCTTLKSGQQRVRDNDGVAAPIEGVLIGSGKLDLRDACKACFDT